MDAAELFIPKNKHANRDGSEKALLKSYNNLWSMTFRSTPKKIRQKQTIAKAIQPVV